MKISLGSDHAGFAYKEEIKKYLVSKGYEVIDCGTYSTDSCDYPIYAKAAAEKVASGDAKYGVLVCSSAEALSSPLTKLKVFVLALDITTMFLV